MSKIEYWDNPNSTTCERERDRLMRNYHRVRSIDAQTDEARFRQERLIATIDCALYFLERDFREYCESRNLHWRVADHVFPPE